MTATSTTPLFSFGIVADPQYADIPARPEMNRFYAESTKKLAAAIDAFNQENLAFVVTLGDLIAHVLVHEIGHHFGLSDDDIHRIEDEA